MSALRLGQTEDGEIIMCDSGDYGSSLAAPSPLKEGKYGERFDRSLATCLSVLHSSVIDSPSFPSNIVVCVCLFVCLFVSVLDGPYLGLQGF